jgi:hypothetical protein
LRPYQVVIVYGRRGAQTVQVEVRADGRHCIRARPCVVASLGVNRRSQDPAGKS